MMAGAAFIAALQRENKSVPDLGNLHSTLSTLLTADEVRNDYNYTLFLFIIIIQKFYL